MNRPHKMGVTLAVLAACLGCETALPGDPLTGPISVRDSAFIGVPRGDNTVDSAIVLLPAGRGEKHPLLVLLHSWQGNFRQRQPTSEYEAVDNGWIYLHPDFRGPNNRPEACGSELAQQDILNAIDYAIAHYAVDPTRVYLAGGSGGGHMALLMAARHPDRFAAVAAGAAIADLNQWRHDSAGRDYWPMLDACGDSTELRKRSPVAWLAPGTLPIDISAGYDDATVPFTQALAAYNLATGSRLMRDSLNLSGPLDAMLGRRVFLRRESGRRRLTIFDGVHEMNEHAAIVWLSQFRRP